MDEFGEQVIAGEALSSDGEEEAVAHVLVEVLVIHDVEAVLQEHLLQQSSPAGILPVFGHEVELSVACRLIHRCQCALCRMANARRQCVKHSEYESASQCVHAESLLKMRIHTVEEFVADGYRCHALAGIAEYL